MDPSLGTGLDPEAGEGGIGCGSLDPPARALDDDRAAFYKVLDRRRYERLACVALFAEVNERISGTPGWDEPVVDKGDVAGDRPRVCDHAVQGVVADTLEDPRGETEHRRRDEHEQPEAERRDAVLAESFQGDEEGRHVSSAPHEARR